MVRSKRQMLRFYFILVIAVGLFGGWYAKNSWQVDTGALSSLNVGEDGDWIDFFAALGEETIQLFLGFTSKE